MSYNTIFSGSFSDINHDVIDIYIKQDGFIGEPSTLIFDANPLVLTYSTKEFYDSIFGCGARINVINNTSNIFYFDNLFSTPERHNYIEIIKTSNRLDSSILLFQGYILPEMYTSTLQKNIKVTIPATDQLSLLDRYIPKILVDTSTYRSDEYLNAFDIIGDIVLDMDITDKIAVHNDLENINYIKSGDASAYRIDKILFDGGGIGDLAFITCNGITKSWEYDEFGGVYLGNQQFVSAWDASYSAVNVSVTTDGSYNLMFTSTSLGYEFSTDTSAFIASTNPDWLLTAHTEYIKGSHDLPNTVFNNIFFQADNFLDKDNVQNEKLCLEKILQPFYSRIYYNNGKFIIERVADMYKDTKEFVLYKKGTHPDITTYTINNDRIKLSDHNILASTAALTYQPGYEKLLLTLNYKQPESLIENRYWDIEYYTKDLVKNSSKPLPKQRRWMMSSTDASLTATPYNSTNVTSGLYYFVNTWNGLNARYDWFKTQYASTMFTFTPDPAGTIIDIKYKVDLSKTMVQGYTPLEKTATSVNSNFALRACDKNGRDWWVAKSTPEDTSTYWTSTFSTSKCLFNSSIGWDDVVKDNYTWDISQQVNITDPIITDVSVMTHQVPYPVYDWEWEFLFWSKKYYKTAWKTETYTVPAKIQYVGELYLDIYPTLYKPTLWYWPSGGYIPYFTWFGDVDADIKIEPPYNVLEASLGYFFGNKELNIDIFDTSTILFTNGIYNVDSDYTYRSIGKWRDDTSDNYIKLQEKYMEDLSQMLSKPKYSLSIDIRSNDSSIWTLGNIYTHDSIKYPDSSLIEFMCNGIDYNVRENAYRLDLLEYIADDNWRVNPSTA